MNPRGQGLVCLGHSEFLYRGVPGLSEHLINVCLMDRKSMQKLFPIPPPPLNHSLPRLKIKKQNQNNNNNKKP